MHEWNGVVNIGSGVCVCVCVCVCEKMVMAGDREYLCLYHLVVSGVIECFELLSVTKM